MPQRSARRLCQRGDLVASLNRHVPGLSCDFAFIVQIRQSSTSTCPSPPRSVKQLKRKIRGLEEALRVEPTGERARELGELKEELDERKESMKKRGHW